MGSKLFMPFLALTITIPFFMYIALWLGKVLSGAGKGAEYEKDNESEKDEKSE